VKAASNSEMLKFATRNSEIGNQKGQKKNAPTLVRNFDAPGVRNVGRLIYFSLK
jgi:hypothetical protein